jgi:hypothetical protein
MWLTHFQIGFRIPSRQIIATIIFCIHLIESDGESSFVPKEPFPHPALKRLFASVRSGSD